MHTTTTLGTLAALVLGLGCTVQTEDNNPFLTSGNPMTTMTPTSGSGGSDSGSGTEGVGSSEEDPSSGAPGDTTMGATTLPMGSTTNTSLGDSTTSGGGMGMQPATGMYSDCSVAMCDATANLCLTITENNIDLGSFCTLPGCANPALDCDPNPGGTASPVCIAVTIDGMPDSACALNCAGGGSCPPPMVCGPVSMLCV